MNAGKRYPTAKNIKISKSFCESNSSQIRVWFEYGKYKKIEDFRASEVLTTFSEVQP